MSSIEPRLTPSRASESSSGNGGGSKPNGSGNGSVTTIPLAAEQALAAVQLRLVQQAEAIRVVPVAPPPVARTAAPLPPPPLPPPPIIIQPDTEEFEERIERLERLERLERQARDAGVDDVDEAAFWGEPPEPEALVDVDQLSKSERKALGRLRARKVRRIVRHVSPWSMFKVSLFFYLCLWLILMVAGVILWKVSQEAGVITNVEKFYAKASGEAVFEVDGRGVFRAAAGAGAILVFAATGFTVLMTILFNLITDLTGGVRLSVIELETARREVRRRKTDKAGSAATEEADPRDGKQNVDDADDPKKVAASPIASVGTAGATASTTRSTDAKATIPEPRRSSGAATPSRAKTAPKAAPNTAGEPTKPTPKATSSAAE